MSQTRDRGAVMVEFAILVPLLLLLILAIVEFGYRYERGTVYNNAAFIAARDYSINHDQAKAKTAANNAGWPSAYPFPTIAACAVGANVTVTLTKSNEPSATGAFGSAFAVTGTGVARCDS